MNEDSGNKKCEIVHDSIFSEKPFKIPLFGFAFANMCKSETYSTEYGAPKIYNLLNVSDRYRVYQTKRQTGNSRKQCLSDRRELFLQMILCLKR